MFKRDAALFGKSLLSALGWLLLLGAICVTAFFLLTGGEKSVYQKVKVAITDGEDSVQSRIVLKLVRETGYISSLLETQIMEEEEAERAFAAGEIAAVICLPDRFTGDILSGGRQEGKILISPAFVSQGEIVAEIAEFGEEMLAAGQNSVFAAEEVLKAHPEVPSSVSSPALSKLEGAVLGEALGSETAFFDEEVTDYGDTGLSLEVFYLSAWMAMLLLLIPIFFLRLYRTDCTPSFLRRLSVCGVSSFGFLKNKTLLTAAGNGLLLLAPALVFARQTGNGISLWGVLFLLLSALFSSVLGACLSLCFGDGILVTVIVSFGGLLLRGGIIPRRMLDPVLRTLGDFSPLGALSEWLSPLFGGECSLFGLLAGAVWMALALLLTFLRLKGVRDGGKELQRA